ncbi:endonuclease/exonuclease/phosphatase family protein [Pseudonocardia ailaonensis]|uniref:Endonuclease/exonuclease/phosphatase family protein n=1 Tax=Pseudonocardia ailaonensis TaxID=367279 RepID=A0ABN2NKE8_9PSEU
MSAPPSHPSVPAADRADEPPPARPAPTRRRPSLTARLVIAALLGLALSVVVLPDRWFGLDQYSPFAQLGAFRPMAFLAVAALVVVLGLITIKVRMLWPFTAAALALALTSGAFLLPRTIADPVPAGGSTLKVLSYNVYEGRADVTTLAALIHAEKPDLIALPEAGERFRQKLAPLIEDLGYRSRSSVTTRQPDVSGVTVFTAARLGDVQFEVAPSDVTFRSVTATGGALGDLRFVGFHSVAPTPGYGVGQWKEDLLGVQQWCGATTPTIVAGDFNATFDHSVMREGTAGCGDAASQAGQGLTSSWPTWAPRWVGPQIDHVLGTSGIAAESFAVEEGAGSDHRPILTTLRVP